MNDSIKVFVQTCEVCQQTKTEHVNVPGLLEPLPVPKTLWTIICMDFVEGLSVSNKKDVIMVIIDKFSKYGHFLALSHPFSALQVAHVYMDNIYKLHGLPESIISNRDKIFTSNVWQQLFRLSDTQLLMSSSYHPQTDGRQSI